MKRILGVAAAVVLTLALTSNAKAQSWGGGYYNPWTGSSVYAGSVYNPWTGGYYSGTTAYNPWLGGYYSTGSGYSPWTGTYYGRQSFYNPYSGTWGYSKGFYNPWTGITATVIVPGNGRGPTGVLHGAARSRPVFPENPDRGVASGSGDLPPPGKEQIGGTCGHSPPSRGWTQPG